MPKAKVKFELYMNRDEVEALCRYIGLVSNDKRKELGFEGISEVLLSIHTVLIEALDGEG